MHPIRILSAAAQVAAHLRSEIERGHWIGNMPGVVWLAGELAVNHKTVEAAVRQLEQEGLLATQGARRCRVIVPPTGKTVRPLRVAILPYDPADSFLAYIVELQHALTDAGHTTVVTTKSLTELAMDPARIARIVKQTEADAWIIQSGSSEVLQWFTKQTTPALALFGRREGIPIAAAGPATEIAYATATRQLIVHGHRRIVLICRSERRKPTLGNSERTFLDELTAHSIPTSDYNMPDWEETTDGFQALLTSLFRVTPPTALIIGEGTFFAATLQFLARKGLRTPEQVSLICMDPDPSLVWCKPTIAYIRWDPAPVLRRIVQWASAVSKGRSNKIQTLTQSEFIPGGTIGPAPVG